MNSRRTSRDEITPREANVDNIIVRKVCVVKASITPTCPSQCDRGKRQQCPSSESMYVKLSANFNGSGVGKENGKRWVTSGMIKSDVIISQRFSFKLFREKMSESARHLHLNGNFYLRYALFLFIQIHPSLFLRNPKLIISGEPPINSGSKSITIKGMHPILSPFQFSNHYSFKRFITLHKF
ncbi:hypothetical protein QVD17_29741 [Tagetes erecta]|uniref:Uncharacterized protein n=1 Tax=Tagetes erecta TaxID=13708 RepID=A0AAD8NLK2_TARER|nr:hypothetical protein QVD17_29741 [Tagetes erecta]